MGEAKKPQPMKLGDAVAKGIIANQTLAYFIGRTWLFFKKVGIDPSRMRFRQHLQHEVRGCVHVGIWGMVWVWVVGWESGGLGGGVCGGMSLLQCNLLRLG